tara:strand:- start:127084 stop:127251 length:168 start_codon:yes stop_codon:yes gene_type:complete
MNGRGLPGQHRGREGVNASQRGVTDFEKAGGTTVCVEPVVVPEVFHGCAPNAVED